jgi:hypothetical protein
MIQLKNEIMSAEVFFIIITILAILFATLTSKHFWQFIKRKRARK